MFPVVHRVNSTNLALVYKYKKRIYHNLSSLFFFHSVYSKLNLQVSAAGTSTLEHGWPTSLHRTEEKISNNDLFFIGPSDSRCELLLVGSPLTFERIDEKVVSLPHRDKILYL